jgi:hypothetical protein
MKFSEKAKQIIAAVAPTIGTAVGGPFGAIAGTALARALGTGPEAAAIEQAVTSGDPDVLLKLKEAENAFALQLEQLGVQRDQLAYQDTANAREREVKLGDWTPRLLAFGILLGWLCVQAYLMTHVIDGTMRELVARVLGTLDGALMLVLGYYFGSSASSKHNDQTLANIAQQP